MATASPAAPPAAAGARQALTGIAAYALLAAALWWLDLHVLHTRVLTPFQGHPPLSPLYAFWHPQLRPAALAFALVAGGLVLTAPALLDPEKISRARFLAVLGALALAVPWTLFLVRPPAALLGSQFLVYPREEFLWDADRIGSLAAFLAGYVEAMREGALSLHGAHFPPGHAALLFLVRRAFGPGAFPAAVAVLGLFALGVVTAFLALRRLASEVAARAGVLLLLASPSLLDFACASMDAVFFALAMLAWWASLRAFRPEGTPVGAILAGAALLLATCFSFSALPVGLAVLLYGLLRARDAWRHLARQLAVAGGAYAAGAGLLFAATGFALWECLAVARESGISLMTRILGASPGAAWGHLSFGNLAAFLIGSGAALAVAAALRLGAGGLRWEAWSVAALLTWSVMGIGGLYFMETERVWLFAMPWLAAIGVARGGPSAGVLRLLLAAGFAQALAMEALLYTIW